MCNAAIWGNKRDGGVGGGGVRVTKGRNREFNLDCRQRAGYRSNRNRPDPRRMTCGMKPNRCRGGGVSEDRV